MGFSYTVRQGGMTVALGDGPTLQAVTREAMHYAMMYGQDGDVTFTVREGRRVIGRGKVVNSANRASPAERSARPRETINPPSNPTQPLNAERDGQGGRE